MPDRGHAVFRGFSFRSAAKCPIFGNYLPRCAALAFLSYAYNQELTELGNKQGIGLLSPRIHWPNTNAAITKSVNGLGLR